MNLAAIDWRRRAARDLAAAQRAAHPDTAVVIQMPRSLESMLRYRIDSLTRYPDAAFVHRVQDAERAAGCGDTLVKAAAQNLFKLMAYNDEYEVTRLFTAPELRQALSDAFEGDVTLQPNLAPPLLGRIDAQGRRLKQRFGAQTIWLFGLLARLQFLRGGPLDGLGRSEEHRTERALIDEYRSAVESALLLFGERVYAIALQLARFPEQIRGFGHVKAPTVSSARAAQWGLLAQMHAVRSMPASDATAQST